jgi:hypothetical protein
VSGAIREPDFAARLVRQPPQMARHPQRAQPTLQTVKRAMQVPRPALAPVRE